MSSPLQITKQIIDVIAIIEQRESRIGVVIPADYNIDKIHIAATWEDLDKIRSLLVTLQLIYLENSAAKDTCLETLIESLVELAEHRRFDHRRFKILLQLLHKFFERLVN